MNLEEVKDKENMYAVFEGDDGGQIYAVIPTKIIKCSEDILKKLLIDIDADIWGDTSMTNLFYGEYEPGSIVGGGMGGGKAEIDLWVHKELLSLKSAITKVINGEKKELSLD